ncbi:Fur family transcriptional regulator [Paracoccus tegillarcae]|uniref:Fur family transcriptional regulator n=1 Tax=Paracoccus tegillarcae TaxID=1529068 RepID=A0A2K9EFX2_9RHOB|nr:Fur family transcriptional regulator [Paracoccus tegillarcae]AUH33858.1 Fur family transcriptional regulator [Paracoccus tegillarcae]
MNSDHLPDDTATAFAPHDHGACRDQALQAAAELADQQGVRLTPVRRRTLEILLESHRALGAYDVLERLSAEGFGSQPPVAYRALDFLVQNGLAHRVQRLNAFAACLTPGHLHAPAFLICRTCNKVAEADAPAIRAALGDAARASGFAVERMTVEALGLCDSCAGVEVSA